MPMLMTASLVAGSRQAHPVRTKDRIAFRIA
jgi:hypothetical protein